MHPKKINHSITTVVATILLLTACKRNHIEVPLVATGKATDVEQYMPGIQGTTSEFTFRRSLSPGTLTVSVEVKDNLAVLEGDIILGPMAEVKDLNAAVIDGATYRWSNSVIPYVISPGHPEKEAILWAINHVNTTTNLCVVPRIYQKDYVQFVTGSGCASYVGRQGGRQDIFIGNCSQGSVAHEILHAAGLWHEQSREDRDNYITINWANIQDGSSHNFNAHVSDGIDIGTYDYGSIMHYGKKAFTKNGRNTMEIKVPQSTSTTTIGQRNGLSTKDREAINSLYKPGPCKEDCIPFNPLNLSVKQSGSVWLVMDGIISLFTAPNKTEAYGIVKIIKYYRLNKSCFVGRPGPSFQYMLKDNLSPVSAMPGEDVIGFNPATITLKSGGIQWLIMDGTSQMFAFPSKIEADLALAIIRQYGFTKTGYVGRPGPSLQYMRK